MLGVQLYEAIEKCDEQYVKLLVEQGATLDITFQLASKESLLLGAARRGCAEITKLLIRSGADVDVRDVQGMTPLMHAVENGHLDVTQVLLAANANTEIETTHRGTALSIAAHYDRPEFIKALIEGGANPNKVFGDKIFGFYTALIFAVRRHNLPSIRALLAGGASLETATPGGSTALRSFALTAYPGRYQKETIDLLLADKTPAEREVLYNQVNEDGEDVITAALKNGKCVAACDLLKYLPQRNDNGKLIDLIKDRMQSENMDFGWHHRWKEYIPARNFMHKQHGNHKLTELTADVINETATSQNIPVNDIIELEELAELCKQRPERKKQRTHYLLSTAGAQLLNEVFKPTNNPDESITGQRLKCK